MVTLTKKDNITSVPDVEASRPIVRYSETEIQNIVNNYVERVLSTPRTASKEAEIDGFFGKVHDAIISRQNSDGVPQDKRILFMADLPPEENEVDTEAITFYLSSRKPGLFQRGSAGDSGIKEVSPHQRYVVPHPENPSEKLVTMGKFYDNHITFCVYARTNKVALDRVLWFERVMSGFNWYFRLEGYSVVVEMGIGEREIVKHGELRLTKYPVSYFVRTDDTFHISSQELRRLVVNANISRQ